MKFKKQTIQDLMKFKFTNIISTINLLLNAAISAFQKMILKTIKLNVKTEKVLFIKIF